MYSRVRILNCFKAGSENVASNFCLLSSKAGCIGLIGSSGYSSSKFALRGLAESLQMESRPYNVSFTLSHPPDTQTPSLEKENEERSALLQEIAESSCCGMRTQWLRRWYPTYLTLCFCPTLVLLVGYYHWACICILKFYWPMPSVLSNRISVCKYINIFKLHFKH